MLSEIFHVYAAPGEKTSPLFAAAFASGLHRHGVKVKVETVYQGGPWAGFGSPANWADLQLARTNGYDWWYADHGYFKRTRHIRVTKGAYQHGGLGQPDAFRLRSLGVSIRAWRLSGSHVLVCPQSDRFFALHGFAQGEWLSSTLDTLKLYTDRKLRIRWKGDTKPIQEDLRDAWCVVTYSSGCAIDGLVEGIPAICTAQCAASIMGTGDLSLIENPPMPPGRVEWAGVLVANQWTINEIRDGKCWKMVGL